MSATLRPETPAERAACWTIITAAALYIGAQVVRALGWWPW